jgi:hypothetical protein
MQLVVIAIIAAVVTVPVVLLVPRVRQSPTFDRILWVATWLLSFLGSWYAVGNSPTPPESFAFADVPLMVALIGAGAGALLLNFVLWLLDRFAPPELPESQLDAADGVVNNGDQSQPPDFS